MFHHKLYMAGDPVLLVQELLVPALLDQAPAQDPVPDLPLEEDSLKK